MLDPTFPLKLPSMSIDLYMFHAIAWEMIVSPIHSDFTKDAWLISSQILYVVEDIRDMKNNHYHNMSHISTHNYLH